MGDPAESSGEHRFSFVRACIISTVYRYWYVGTLQLCKMGGWWIRQHVVVEQMMST